MNDLISLTCIAIRLKKCGQYVCMLSKQCLDMYMYVNRIPTTTCNMHTIRIDLIIAYINIIHAPTTNYPYLINGLGLVLHDCLINCMIFACGGVFN